MGIGYYLQFPFAQHALEAAFLVAISCGLIGPFVITRTMSFAVHGTSELAFTGAVAGLLVADNPLVGALVGALVVAALIGILGQRAVTRLIDERRRQAGSPVVFVTHEVNPVLPYVDRILYLVRGRWAIGTPAEILTSERLSALYGIEVDVVKVRDRYLVVSAEDELPTEPGAHAHHDHAH